MNTPLSISGSWPFSCALVCHPMLQSLAFCCSLVAMCYRVACTHDSVYIRQFAIQLRCALVYSYVAVCCSLLQFVAVSHVAVCFSLLQFLVVYCRLLQSCCSPLVVLLRVCCGFVAGLLRVCCGVLQRGICPRLCLYSSVCHSAARWCCAAVCCSLLQSVAVRRSLLQCVAVCCSMLQCVAVCCSMPYMCPAVGHSTARW